MSERRRTVALVFGGRSSEHGVSCVTAACVLDAMDTERFDVIPVGIAKNGKFVLLEAEDLAGYSLDGDSLPEVPDTGRRVLWPDSVDSRELQVIENGELRRLGTIDVAMPMLHGPYGEDGTVQGLFELTDIPYVGSGVLGSALCMDKRMIKPALEQAGIAVAPWAFVTRAELAADPSLLDRLDDGLTYPLFVKPTRAGSSVGVSRITQREELAGALEIAFREDHSAILESGVTGREIEIGVLQGRAGAAPRTTDVVGEIQFTGRDFYDFEAKYLGAAGAEVVLPAAVTAEELATLQQTAAAAFEATGCAGYARVDFFLTEDGPIVNEINTLPGCTPISMFPKLWEASGLEYADLITELIELALETER